MRFVNAVVSNVVVFYARGEAYAQTYVSVDLSHHESTKNYREVAHKMFRAIVCYIQCLLAFALNYVPDVAQESVYSQMQMPQNSNLVYLSHYRSHCAAPGRILDQVPAAIDQLHRDLQSFAPHP